MGTIADARNAIGRLEECFTAELVSEMLVQDSELKHAIEIENASFTWDGPPSIRVVMMPTLTPNLYPNRIRLEKRYCSS